MTVDKNISIFPASPESRLLDSSISDEFTYEEKGDRKGSFLSAQRRWRPKEALDRANRRLARSLLIWRNFDPPSASEIVFVGFFWNLVLFAGMAIPVVFFCWWSGIFEFLK